MNTDEKLNYMIGCLQAAKDEMDHMAEYHMVETESHDSMEKRGKYWKYIERTGKPNKSLEHDWECDKKCNTCEMQELCEKLEEKE